MASLALKVCIPHTHRNFFDYQMPECPFDIGVRVWVPFRNKLKIGFVVGQGEPENPGIHLKTPESVIDDKPVLPAELLSLCLWMSDYYQSPLSEIIPLALPKKFRLTDDKRQVPALEHYYLLINGHDAYSRLATNAKRQHALVHFLAQHAEPVSKKQITQAGFTTAQLHALINANLVGIKKCEISLLPSVSEIDFPLVLNTEQSDALQQIKRHLNHYHACLLYGVTGSGKTEVYLHAIQEILDQGRQVLVLVPEIGLTPQLLKRFSSRFNQAIAVLHSNLNDNERQLAWQLAYEARVQVVIGTRSAIFTPMPKLGLIIIDEEHDASFKQMDGVRYSARDAALMRAYRLNIPIILGSATPSLESLHNAQINKYSLLRLNHKAESISPLHFRILDIRNQHLQDGLAEPTLDLIREHLQQKNQVLVFINRRGYAPVILCHQCGWMADCKACDSHLTLHRTLNRLLCHHCGLTQPVFKHCQTCKSNDLVPVGAGTQRVYDFLAHQFTNVKMLRVDRDEVRKKHAFDDHLARINSGEVQLIVGTQMLAKGHHFPRLTLVVILDTDTGFYNQDFRALERLGQLLLQVSGRAGRAEFPGQVLIQTHVPDHPLLNTLIQRGYDPFARELLAIRAQALLPPYAFLALIRAQGPKLPQVLTFLHNIKHHLSTLDINLLGPAPAPLARKAGNHRMQLLLKSTSRKMLQAILNDLRYWLMQQSHPGIRWSLDIDPIDLA